MHAVVQHITQGDQTVINTKKIRAQIEVIKLLKVIELDAQKIETSLLVKINSMYGQLKMVNPFLQ